MKIELAIPTVLDQTKRRYVFEALKRSYAIQSLTMVGNSFVAELLEEVDPTALANKVEELVGLAQMFEKKLLYQQTSPHRMNTADPLPELMRRGDVARVAKGMFLFQGEFLRLLRGIDRYWRNTAFELGAVEQDLPVLWPVELMRQINYFKEFPQQVIMGAPLKGDSNTLTRIARDYDKEQDYTSFHVENNLAESGFCLQCAVCDNCYYMLRNRSQHPNTIYTIVNKVFRNECSERDSLDRLTQYTMREIVFTGTAEFVLQQREIILQRVKQLLGKLGVQARIETANDAFFANDSIAMSVYQYASELKYEILVELPFAAEDLAVGSINLHQDFFGRAFNITASGDKTMWSACIGIGFERFAYALYAQFGCDTSAWPEAARFLIADEGTE